MFIVAYVLTVLITVNNSVNDFNNGVDVLTVFNTVSNSIMVFKQHNNGLITALMMFTALIAALIAV